MNQHYDAIIIGAGSVGNPTAYFLAQHNMKVLVLEELAASGQGENKAAIGGVRATHSDPAKIQICLKSLEIFSNWEQKTGTNIGWKKGGYCFPVFREQEEQILKSILPIQKSYGLIIDWFNHEKIQEIVPGINKKNLRGGTYSPHDGQVSPLLAAESFTNEATRLGADFHYKEPVTNLLMSKNTITGVKTKQNTYTANYIINTAGAHASAICKMAGLDIPVNPDSHEAGISAPIKPFLDPLVVDLRPGPECKTANFYFGQNQEGQIYYNFSLQKFYQIENSCRRFESYDRKIKPKRHTGIEDWCCVCCGYLRVCVCIRMARPLGKGESITCRGEEQAGAYRCGQGQASRLVVNCACVRDATEGRDAKISV